MEELQSGGDEVALHGIANKGGGELSDFVSGAVVEHGSLLSQTSRGRGFSLPLKAPSRDAVVLEFGAELFFEEQTSVAAFTVLEIFCIEPKR